LILTAGCYNDIQFARFGRGQYFRAMQYMYNNAESREITFTSNHDFKVVLIVSFFAPLLGNEKTWLYKSADESSASGGCPEWVLFYSANNPVESYPYIRNRFEFSDGCQYALQKKYPYAGHFSGYTWDLFHYSQPDSNQPRRHD
jgi:hypothetical protein